MNWDKNFFIANHKKYGRTLLKCILFIDSGTVLKILNSGAVFSFTSIMDAKLLQR